MASSFTVPPGGTPTPLTVLADGIPRRRTPGVSVRKMPGGNVTYIDLPGPSLPTVDLSLLFLSGADALAFEALEGQRGTLVWFDGSQDAVLMEVSRASRGVNTSGPTVISAQFLLI